MEFTAGTQLGPYELISLIGAGGMGEVYRGKDSRLGREVAIKILPPQLSGNTDRVRRFEQEARATGILNHPNILTIYDIGSFEDSVFIVSELLIGETLREKMGGSPLPPRKAVEYGLQIAHGLAAAHERGIVHRDLKPENIFVTRDGRIKILDFGLAKLTAPEPAVESQSRFQTVDPGTQPGMVMGTVGYMSPEQVRGLPLDHRSDIFSFGTILYEMIAGKRAFHRGSTADTMSAILKEDPPEFSGTNTNFPPAMQRVIRHCLEKNMEERFQSARDLAFDLEMISGISGTEASQAVVRPVPPARFRRPLPFALMVVAAAVIAFFAGRLSDRGGKTGIIRNNAAPTFQRLSFRRGYLSMARFAPDGQNILYSAAWSGQPTEIFSTRPQSPVSRSLGLPTADLLSISRNGEMAVLLNPRFFLGWQRTGTLARVPIDGGAPREVLENVQDADWAPKGDAMAVVRVTPGKYRLEYPVGKILYQTTGWLSNIRVSPKGDRIGFMEHPGNGDDRGVVAMVDLKGNMKKLTGEWASEAGLAWSKDGDEIWFTASKTGSNQQPLYAINLAGELRVVTAMAGNLVVQDVSSTGQVLLTQDSRRREMIALPPGQTKEQDLSWFDWSFPRDLSDDGNWILFEEQGTGGGVNYSVYLRKLDGSPAVHLGEGYALALSPDRTQVISGIPAATLHPVILPTGAGEPKKLNISGVNLQFFARWFPDGKRILFAGAEPNLLPRLWIYDLSSGKMQPVTPEAISGPAAISPDQKFILAPSIGQGYSLYPVDGDEPKDVPALTSNDIPLRWSADGKSVFIREGRGIMMKVFLVNLSTGQRTLWKEITPLDPAGMNDVTQLYLSVDGKIYVYTYRRILSDLYLANGLR
jgi:eukaryotic-like serine/threonine-protein kinase